MKYIAERKRICKDVGSKTNEDFDGRMKKMWVGIRDTEQTNRGGRNGNSYIKSTKR